MTKKEQILQLLKEGKTLEEIQQTTGFRKVYVQYIAKKFGTTV